MGIFGDAWEVTKDVAGWTPPGLMYRAATDEEFQSKVPGLRELTGARSKEEKDLIKKQEELAREARRRMQQMEQARMNALAQKVQAFNPQNQMMAQMFGPEAAFTPEQFAAMTKNPIPDAQPWGTGTMEERAEQVRRRDAERERQETIKRNMAPVPPGPAAFNLAQPARARRY